MKKTFLLFSILLALFTVNNVFAQDTEDKTNDFYDNSPTLDLPFQAIEIAGEISNPKKIDLTTLPLHSIIVKEAVLKNNKDTFVGAYRYDGYSLYDILNNIVLNKKNKVEYSSVIDLYVEIENDKGEKVIFSWGEIFYPVHRHEIIIATKVARIVPSKTKDLWPLPQNNKIVAAADIITERNISNPVKITIKSFPKSFPTVKDAPDNYSAEIKIIKNDKQTRTISSYPENIKKETYPCVFYGRGKGIHGINTFEGAPLKDVLANEVSITKEMLQKGLIAVIAKDGFRCVYTVSEVFNRNDQAQVLFIDRKTDKKFGAFSVFPAPDFFSDRAVKAITEIHITY